MVDVTAEELKRDSSFTDVPIKALARALGVGKGEVRLGLRSLVERGYLEAQPSGDARMMRVRVAVPELDEEEAA